MFANLEGDAASSEYSSYLVSFLSNLKDDENKVLFELSGDSAQCRIFIHWGGGEREDVLFYEREITKLLENKWRLFSLGTNRNNIFNVDRNKIIVPASAKELDEIEKKFANEQDFGGVVADSVLTKVANRDGELGKNDRTALESLMCEMKRRILFSSLPEDKKKELLIGIGEILISCSSNRLGSCSILKFSDIAVSVARKILNKEVFNG